MAGDFIQRSRHGTVFYFRRRVPVDLRPRLGRSHLYASLRTESLAEAKHRARACAAATDRLFTELRYMSGDDKDKQARTYYGVFLDFDEAGRPRVKFDDVKPGEEVSAGNLAKRILESATLHNSAPRSDTTPTVAEAIQAVLASGDLKPTTRKEYERFFERFAAFVGPATHLGEISQGKFAEYADHVNSASKFGNATKKNQITAAELLFSFHRRRNSAVPAISARGLKPKRSKPAGHDRDAFTLDDISVLFANAAQYREAEPHKWWVTVAPAFLGCRIEELAQAHLNSDIYEVASGCWVLKIEENHNSETGKEAVSPKSVKSLAGWRKVPIHPSLVDCGFVTYLNRERTLGALTPFGRYWTPFKDQKTGGTKHSHGITKWGGRELAKLRAAGKMRPGKLTYFHSLRHTFVTTLARAGIHEEWRAALAGQAYGGVNAVIYNKAREDESVTLPVILSGLKQLADILAVIASSR